MVSLGAKMTRYRFQNPLESHQNCTFETLLLKSKWKFERITFAEVGGRFGKVEGTIRFPGDYGLEFELTVAEDVAHNGAVNHKR